MHAEIPQYLITAVILEDLPVLLRFWEEVAHPIPDEGWGPDHPLFPVVCYVAYAIEDYGVTCMDEEQRLASLWRESVHNPKLPYAWA